jgi:hypothetical protein
MISDILPSVFKKIETEPKIRKRFSRSHQDKYLNQDLAVMAYVLALTILNVGLQHLMVAFKSHLRYKYDPPPDADASDPRALGTSLNRRVY